MPSTNPVQLIDVDTGMGVEFHPPPRMPVESDRDVGHRSAAGDRLQCLYVSTEVAYLLPAPGISARVRHHPRVKFLPPGPGTTPLEEQPPVGAAGDVRHAVPPHLSLRLRGV